jgi:hypothetical protein
LIGPGFRLILVAIFTFLEVDKGDNADAHGGQRRLPDQFVVTHLNSPWRIKMDPVNDVLVSYLAPSMSGSRSSSMTMASRGGRVQRLRYYTSVLLEGSISRNK